MPIGRSRIHQTMIAAWKRQAIEGLAPTFSGKAEAAVATGEAELGLRLPRSRGTVCGPWELRVGFCFLYACFVGHG
jgi:hypothetical protein